VNVKKHLKEVIKDHEAYLAKNIKLEKDRDLWKGRCNQMVGGIMPVLDLIDPELLATDTSVSPGGVIDKCQRALGWIHQFVKEAGEYAGAHMLSMVRAHYPLIDLALGARVSQGGWPEASR
jgi:hypothetical protein